MLEGDNKIPYYNFRLFLLVCPFPVTYQTLGPTGLKKNKIKRKGKRFGHALLTIVRVYLHNSIIVVHCILFMAGSHA